MQQSLFWESKRSAVSQENSPHFMEPDGSLPHSQQPATCFYPRPNFSYRRTSLILSSQIHVRIPSGPFPSGLPTKTLYALFLSPTSSLTTQEGNIPA